MLRLLARVWTLEYFVLTCFTRADNSHDIAVLINEHSQVCPWRYASPEDLGADWLSCCHSVAEVQIF